MAKTTNVQEAIKALADGQHIVRSHWTGRTVTINTIDRNTDGSYWCVWSASGMPHSRIDNLDGSEEFTIIYCPPDPTHSW